MDILGQWAYDLIEKALSLLPDSPFQFLTEINNSPMYQWLSVLNWFIPVSILLSILEAWCSAILIYYVLQILLRWAKAIE